MAWCEEPGADDRGEPDRTCADDGDRFGRPDRPIEDANLVAGREYVGEHEHLLIADIGRYAVQRVVRERGPHELGLRAVDPVAEDPATTAEALSIVAFAAVLASTAGSDA